MAADRTIGGRYSVGRKIAEGGMGAVFEATHILSKKVVALKLLAPSVGRDETTRQRFLREVAAPAQIGHDGIVEIYDAGFDPGEGILFVAMELLSGETLRDRLLRGRLPHAQVLDLFEQMLQPLAAAHRAGIVHRDLKPENVFLARRRDGAEVVKVLDFGIARDLAGQDTVTQAGTAMGTPHYMSPEQAMSARDVSFSTDVWALGVMLYEALSGAPPFAGDTIATLVVEICTKPHRPLGQVLPGAAPAIVALVDRCLDKDAKKRPPDAGGLLTALRQARGSAAPAPATVTRELAPTMMQSQQAFTAPGGALGPPTGPIPTAATAPAAGMTTPAGKPSFPATAAMSRTPPPGSAPPELSPPTASPGTFSRTPGSQPGYAPAPHATPASTPGYAPAPAGRPRWVAPVAIVSVLGCLGVLGVVVLVFGLAVIGVVASGDREVDGELAQGDGLYGRGQFGDSYDYSWSSGDHVVVALSSPDFDTVLVVRTPSGREIINDDQGFGNLNSRIDMVAPESGAYRVTATSYAPRTTGRYHLSVQRP